MPKLTMFNDFLTLRFSEERIMMGSSEEDLHDKKFKLLDDKKFAAITEIKYAIDILTFEDTSSIQWCYDNFTYFNCRNITF